MIVLVTLVAHRQHDEFRRADDLVQRDLPSGAERNDSFALTWVVPGRFVKVEGRDRQPEPHHHPDSADRSLGAFKVFGCFGVIEQEVKEAFQVSSGCNRQLNDKINRPSFSRQAASLDRSFYKTTSTSTKTLVWCYFSDVASARALKEVWTRRKTIALCTVASTKSVRFSPCLSTKASSAHNTRNTRTKRIWGIPADVIEKARCVWVALARLTAACLIAVGMNRY